VRKRDRLEEQLAALHALGPRPETPEAIAQVRKALGDRSGFVVAAAAALVGKAELGELAPACAAAFARLVEGGAASDKGCKAKAALVLALDRLQWTDAEPFLRGVRHVQMEPVFGGRVDTAAELRGLCAMALARICRPDVMNHLVALLADTERAARAWAARAIAATGREEAIALLRFKALVGDEDPQVLTECWAGLLDLRPAESLAFVTAFLSSDDRPPSIAERGNPPAVAEAAALALGQSRREEAFEPLVAWSEARMGDDRRVALVALAMLRAPRAWDHLVALIAEAAPALAGMAVEALAMHRYHAELRERVRAAVEKRRSRELARAFAEAFAVEG
jgi:hypothetical protein